MYFAKDSLTVIDSSILTDGKSAFNTTSDIAKVTVEPGANLVLGNIEEVGDYTIVNGYITGGNESGGMWTGGWTGDNLYALPQDGSGINWILTLHNDPSKIWSMQRWPMSALSILTSPFPTLLTTICCTARAVTQEPNLFAAFCEIKSWILPVRPKSSTL